MEGNQAGERGGAVYVTRESTVTFDACGSLRNSASLGAAVYAAHSFVALTGGSALAYDEVGALGGGAELALFCAPTLWL